MRFFVEAALEVLADGQQNCVFAIAGNYTGPRSDSDEDFVSALIANSPFGGCFRLLGRVENSEIPGLYAASHHVVMPSLLEATSLSAMEAMASGKAVLSTNVGGLPFLVRDGENGILVPPADSHALAKGMKHLLANPDLCARQGAGAPAPTSRNARERAEKTGCRSRRNQAGSHQAGAPGSGLAGKQEVAAGSVADRTAHRHGRTNA